MTSLGHKEGGVGWGGGGVRGGGVRGEWVSTLKGPKVKKHHGSYDTEMFKKNI